MYTTIQKGLALINERYLTDKELRVVDEYVASFSNRVKAHQLLKQSAEKLADLALQELARTEPTAVEQHRHLCMRDLLFITQMVANAVVTNNDQGFNDSLLWLQNILRSLKKEGISAKAYQLLLGVIQKQLPPECVAVITPCLEKAIEMVSLPV